MISKVNNRFYVIKNNKFKYSCLKNCYSLCQEYKYLYNINFKLKLIIKNETSPINTLNYLQDNYISSFKKSLSL